jgi:ubiquinone/menaquinone biosynthesis C-methylase UbiE
VTELDAKLRAVGAMWGGADYDRLAQLFAPVHDRLVAALEPRAGERWLDLATGTGEVALRAARAGAKVVGLDLSEGLLAQARAKPGGDAVNWILGDVQRLPFEDRSFDVVSSSFGVIFGPDADAVARELARVARPDGRLGLTTWAPDEEFDSLWEPFVDEAPPFDTDRWGTRESLERLLTGFELEIERGESIEEAESTEALWEFFVTAVPPVKALHDSLEPGRREEMRQVFLDAHERYRSADGVRVPREYLLVLGRRR